MKCQHCVEGYIQETGFEICNHCHGTAKRPPLQRMARPSGQAPLNVRKRRLLSVDSVLAVMPEYVQLLGLVLRRHQLILDEELPGAYYFRPAGGWALRVLKEDELGLVVRDRTPQLNHMHGRVVRAATRAEYFESNLGYVYDSETPLNSSPYPPEPK